MRGRYTPYAPELAVEICERVAGGRNLDQIARETGMPGRSTLTSWLNDQPEFRALYEIARARRTKMDRGVRPDAPPPPNLKRGYTRGKAQAVCARLAAGASLNQLAQDHGVAGVTTIYAWLDEHEEFRRMYRAACDARADLLADEATAIADDVDGEAARDRLRIDVRKWRVSVMEPRRYGRNEDDDRPLTHEDILAQLY